MVVSVSGGVRLGLRLLGEVATTAQPKMVVQAQFKEESPMGNSLISCIVPVYNGEQYLREALDSILAQGYRPIEVIVVDDGSTDGTRSVVESYNEQVRYLWQPNAGLAATPRPPDPRGSAVGVCAAAA